jgi:hypothetical protein
MSAHSAAPNADVSGRWTYRSYHNDPSLVGADSPAARKKAYDLILGEGVFQLAVSAHGAITGPFDMGGGYLMDMTGTVSRPPHAPVQIEMRGTGRAGTPTAGWIYDYRGFVVPAWPHGVKQVEAIVGTTIRAVPHNGEPAGVTASIIMVRS